MLKGQKSHFVIPDEEVDEEVDGFVKSPAATVKPKKVAFAEHGLKLGDDLRNIEETLAGVNDDSSLKDIDMLVFSLKLPEGVKIQDQKSLFDSIGIRLLAVKNENSAIVAATQRQFQALMRHVDAYAQKGTLKTRFGSIENFSPVGGSEKYSSGLRKSLRGANQPAELDVQLIPLPNLERDMYDSVLARLIDKIKRTGGKIQSDEFYLSDNTPVVRAIIPTATLSLHENDPAIHRIEDTGYFSVGLRQG